MDFKKSLFEYDNYRSFLKDYYAEAKARNKNFSYRFFARISETGSPSFLKHVIDGSRNLTPAVIEKFIKALKLTKGEAEYFTSLVHLNQAKTSEEKEFYAQQMIKCRLFKKFHPLAQSQLNYYEQWYFVAIRELVSLPHFNEDPEWIGKQLSPSVSPAEARRALQQLLQMGMLVRNEQGRLVQAQALVSTGHEVSSALVARFHKEMLKKAAESIDRFSRSHREISSGTFAVSHESLKMIKEKIQNFRREIQELALKDANSQLVCQFNLQLFPLSQPVTEDEDEK